MVFTKVQFIIREALHTLSDATNGAVLAEVVAESNSAFCAFIGYFV